MKFTQEQYLKFNKLALGTLGKLQPLLDSALLNSSTKVQNFVAENQDLLGTEKGFAKFMEGIDGTKLHEVVGNMVSASIHNAVKGFAPITERVNTPTEIAKLMGQFKEHGVGDVLNSIESEEGISSFGTTAKILNSYEPSENGDFGLNRIMTTLSLRLAQVTRAEILRTNITKFLTPTTGLTAFKKELLRLGIQGQYLTPEQMASAVGSINFEKTGSIEVNQTSIPVAQFTATVRWNRINAIMNQSLNINLIEELINIVNVSFDVAIERTLQYGVISNTDGTRLRGLLTYPDATIHSGILTEDLTTNVKVEDFADKLVLKWKEESFTNTEGSDAIIRPFNVIVFSPTMLSKWSRALLTSNGYPLNSSTVVEYLQKVINSKISVYFNEDINVSIITSPFTSGAFLDGKTGDTGSEDRIAVYNNEGAIFDYTKIPAFGFNTDDNVTFQNRSLMFMSQPELKFKSDDMMLVGDDRT